MVYHSLKLHRWLYSTTGKWLCSMNFLLRKPKKWWTWLAKEPLIPSPVSHLLLTYPRVKPRSEPTSLLPRTKFLISWNPQHKSQSYPLQLQWHAVIYLKTLFCFHVFLTFLFTQLLTNIFSFLTELPIARRASLHRFLAKRKDRVTSKAPYQLSDPAKASSKPQTGDNNTTSWLGLAAQIWRNHHKPYRAILFDVCIKKREYMKKFMRPWFLTTIQLLGNIIYLYVFDLFLLVVLSFSFLFYEGVVLCLSKHPLSGLSHN